MRRLASLALIAVLASSCKRGSSGGEDLAGATDLFGATRTSEMVLRVLKARLEAQAQMGEQQAELVTDSARRRIAEAAALNLLEAGASDYRGFAINMTTGALAGFVDPGLGIGKRSALNLGLSVVVSNTFLEMKGRVTGIDEPEFAGFVSRVNERAGGSLDEAGYSYLDVDKAIELVMKASVGSLGESGIITASNGAEIVAASVRGGVRSIAGLTAAPLNTAIEEDNLPEVSYSGVVVDPDKLATFDPEKSFESFDPTTLEISNTDARPQDVHAVSLYKAMRGTITSLGSSGFSSDVVVPILKHASFAMVDGLDQSTDAATMIAVLPAGTFGAIQSVKSLSLDINTAIAAAGQIGRGVAAGIMVAEKLDDTSAGILVEAGSYVMTAQITAIADLDATSLDRVLQSVVAGYSQGIAAGTDDTSKRAKITAGLVAASLSGYGHVRETSGITNLPEKVDVASRLCAAALASTGGDATTSGLLRTAIGANAKFLAQVPDDFDLTTFWDGVEHDAKLLTQLASAPHDPFGEPAKAPTDESTIGTGEGGGEGGGEAEGTDNSLFAIGGTVSGLSGGTLVLSNSGSETVSVTANGAFSFPTEVASGESYAVTVQTQPAGQTCSVASGSGTATADVSSVSVTCVTYYSISGNVSGLSGGTLVLSNNGAETVNVTADGSFSFPTEIAGGNAYSVTVQTQPTGQYCRVTSGSGTTTSDVTTIAVACFSAKRVYSTVAFSGNRGGVTGADNDCAADANKPGDVATVRALIVDTAAGRVACTTANCSGGIGENTMWALAPQTAYIRTTDSGLIGITTTSAIFTFPLSGDWPATGMPTKAWTGLNPNWTTSIDTCNDWTSANSFDEGFAGVFNSTTTDAISESFSWSCNNPGSQAALLCVEQ